MAQYTIEDIEILRQKGGISYEEAVNLLEYHNGSLARALVDMEKNGRIKDTPHRAAASHKKGSGVFGLMYRTRILVSKGNVTIVNLSLFFTLLVLLFATWVAVAGFVLALILGYRISFERNSSPFSDSWDNVVKHAASNAKTTVYEMASEITGKKAAQPTAETQPEPQPAPENRAEAAASGTTPVNVQFPGEGSVNVRDDADGFHEAEIR